MTAAQAHVGDFNLFEAQVGNLAGRHIDREMSESKRRTGGDLSHDNQIIARGCWDVDLAGKSW